MLAFFFPLIFSGRVAFFFFILFFGCSYVYFLFNFGWFLFLFFFFLENSFGIIFYAIFLNFFTEVSIYIQFFKKYNVLLFVLFNRDNVVNLYKFYFQRIKKVFHLSTFPPFQSNTNERN